MSINLAPWVEWPVDSRLIGRSSGHAAPHEQCWSYPGLVVDRSDAAAREMGVSSQATHKLAGGRAEFLGQVVATFLSRRWAWMTTGDRPARIPTSEEELHGLRVYRLLVELAAGEHRAGREGLARQLDRDRHRYRDWVRYSANQRRSAPMTEDDLDRFEVIVDGLLTAMVRPLDALSPDLAQAILDEYLATTGWRAAG